MKPQIWLVSLAVSLLAATAQAETTLRWQLEPGDKLTLAIEQQTATDVAYVGQQTSTQIDVQLTAEWVVQSANNDRFIVRQKLQRILFQMQSPRAGKVEVLERMPGGVLARPTQDLAPRHHPKARQRKATWKRKIDVRGKQEEQ